MKRFIGLAFIMLSMASAWLVISPVNLFASERNSTTLVNRIEGIVWSPERQPVADIYVELLNDSFSSAGRIRTGSSGRFSFTGIPAARYTVKVLTSGSVYSEYSENIDLVTFTSRQSGLSSSDAVYLDIYLKYDKRKANIGVGGTTGAVFVQQVPDEARRLFQQGVKELNEKNDTGFERIEEALKIFPDYFDALNTLGREYTERKEYQKALPFLVKSIGINQRSFSSFYALAYSLYKLNHRAEALEAARGARILGPNSINAQLLYGTLLRLDEKYEGAEESLLKAKKLAEESPTPEIHWQLALLYNRTNRNKQAAEELKTFLKLKPDAADKEEIKKLIIKLQTENK
ncbi:MAG TPA: tetratricopeptide repeat protein [Pyrinomonadaceae bacterium]|jgi:tetratricopeptide (TPR) repeat protein